MMLTLQDVRRCAKSSKARVKVCWPTIKTECTLTGADSKPFQVYPGLRSCGMRRFRHANQGIATKRSATEHPTLRVQSVCTHSVHLASLDAAHCLFGGAGCSEAYERSHICWSWFVRVTLAQAHLFSCLSSHSTTPPLLSTVSTTASYK